MAKIAKTGDSVSVHYTGTLADGSVFDSSKNHGKPLVFKLGEGRVIEGFETAIVGLEVGQSKKVSIPFMQAYGERKVELTQKVPRDKLPQDQEPKVGMMLGVKAPDGMQFPALITEVTKDHVTLDLNHPLAGKDLTFDIELVDVGVPLPVEHEHVHDENCNHEHH